MSSPFFKKTLIAAKDVAAFLRKAARKQFDVNVIAKDKVDIKIMKHAYILVNNVSCESVDDPTFALYVS